MFVLLEMLILFVEYCILCIDIVPKDVFKHVHLQNLNDSDLETNVRFFSISGIL